MAEYKGIAVYCEIKENNLLPIAAEGLGIGRKLADDLGEELAAILVGSNIGEIAQRPVQIERQVYYLNSLAISRNCGCSAVFNNSNSIISVLLISMP